MLDEVEESLGSSSNDSLQGSDNIQRHPVKDAERLREAALGKVRMPNFFFVAFESLSLTF